MFDLDKEICVCNSLSMKEIRDCIKEHDIQSLDQLLEQDHLPMGDKCESCIEEGYDNDGFSLAMVLSLTKQKRI